MVWKHLPVILGLAALPLGACTPQAPPAVLQSGSIPIAQEYSQPPAQPVVKKAVAKKRVKRRAYRRRTVAAKKTRTTAARPAAIAAPAIPLPVTPVEPAPIAPLTPDQRGRYQLDPFQETPTITEPPRLQ